MKKLLVMASLFYPQKNGGGPPVSIMNVVQAIKNNFEIYIISKNHEVGSSEKLPGIEQGWKEYDFGKVFYFDYGQHTIGNVYRLICEINPDVIYQNSFFSYDDVIPVLRYKRKHRSVGVVIAPRGEVCEKRFAAGRAKKVLYIRLLRCAGLLKGVQYQATGDEELRDIHRYIGAPESDIYNINNFSHVNEDSVTSIEKQAGELSLCFVARIQDTKNLLYGVERLKSLRGNVNYDIYGPIENQEYYNRCFSVVLPANVRLRYCGAVDHDDVGKVISRYHAFYMPTIGENYGHSIVEAMMYARPVVISDMTPWTSINEAGGGYAIALDQPKVFEKRLNELCRMDNETYQRMCASAKAYISKQLNLEEIVQQYIACFNEV